MLTMSAYRNNIIMGGARCVAAAAAILLSGVTFGAAQTAPGLSDAPGIQGAGGIAPVIAAPGDPGRAAPGALSREAMPQSGKFNSFAANEAPPPLDSFTPPSLPVVVELFTSQGCSSCPPADAMLENLVHQPGVLPLSFHVDYWDYLGWSDSFASPEFTQRQEAYARASGEHALYTPQMIVDGRDTAVAPGPAQLMALIDANRIAPAMIGVQRVSNEKGEEIALTPLSDLGGPVEIVLVRYAPHRTVKVKAGENRGKMIGYTNVVLSIRDLAHWDGSAPLRMTVTPDDNPEDDFPEDTRHVLLVQRGIGAEDLPGPILAAIKLD